MKDWKYYDTPAGMKYFGFADETVYRQQLIDEINNKPMTASEREIALKGVKRRVVEYAFEENGPYRVALDKLREEFWIDAREELGYEDFLNEESIKLLESKADEDGHAFGFAEIYSHLQDIVEFVKELMSRSGIKVSNYPNAGNPFKRFTLELPENCEVNFDDGVVTIDI